MGILINLIVSGLAVIVTTKILEVFGGATIDGDIVQQLITGIIVAVILGLINAFIKPIINILTLPINMLTLGLFSFILNGIFILVVSNFVTGFHVSGFLWAVVFSVFLSFVNTFFGIFKS